MQDCAQTWAKSRLISFHALCTVGLKTAWCWCQSRFLCHLASERLRLLLFAGASSLPTRCGTGWQLPWSAVHRLWVTWHHLDPGSESLFSPTAVYRLIWFSTPVPIYAFYNDILLCVCLQLCTGSLCVCFHTCRPRLLPAHCIPQSHTCFHPSIHSLPTLKEMLDYHLHEVFTLHYQWKMCRSIIKHADDTAHLTAHIQRCALRSCRHTARKAKVSRWC